MQQLNVMIRLSKKGDIMYEVVSRLIVDKGWKYEESVDDKNNSVFETVSTDEDGIGTLLIIIVDPTDTLLRVSVLKKMEYINERNYLDIVNIINSVSFSIHAPVSFSVIQNEHFVTKYLLEGKYVEFSEEILCDIIAKSFHFSDLMKEKLDDDFGQNRNYEENKISA